jgi:hypothetical protein
MLGQCTQRLLLMFRSRKHWMRSSYNARFSSWLNTILKNVLALSRILRRPRVLAAKSTARQILANFSHFEAYLLRLISLQCWLHFADFIRVAVGDAKFHFPFILILLNIDKWTRQKSHCEQNDLRNVSEAVVTEYMQSLFYTMSCMCSNATQPKGVKQKMKSRKLESGVSCQRLIKQRTYVRIT